MSHLNLKTNTQKVLSRFENEEKNLSICERIKRAKLFAKSAKEIISSPFPPKSTERAVKQLNKDLKENQNQIKCLTEQGCKANLNIFKDTSTSRNEITNPVSESTSYQSHIRFSKITEFETETTNSPSKHQHFSNYSSEFLSFDPRSKIPDQKFSPGDSRVLFVCEDMNDSYDYSPE